MRMLSVWMLTLFICQVVCVFECRASDWPMWRCDAGRTGSTEAELSAELHLQWVRKLPVLGPTWSGVSDLSRGKGIDGFNPSSGGGGFEIVYSPIVLGNAMFVGSSLNDSLMAIDVATGKEKWRFHTEGAIRLAPAGWENKVYVASDDGYLYCVNATDGKLVWKFRGAPAKHRIIGDERFMSAWPCRGGPVVADGVVYFSAGMFPFMGIYIYALDAGTGKKIWVNDDRGPKWNGRGGSQTSPQGPMAVVGDKLLIPNSRTSVSCFDRKTGKFLYHPSQSSHWRVCGAGEYFYLEGRFGRRGTLHHLATGKPIAELPGFPVVSKQRIFLVDPSGSRSVVELDPSKVPPAKNPRKLRVKIAPRWTFKVQGKGSGNYRAKVVSGSRVYVTNGNRIAAVEVPAQGEAAKESWSAGVEGEIGEVLVAADRLFVVTMKGGIYCFGGAKGIAVSQAESRNKIKTVADAWTSKAAAILKSTGVKAGYALVWVNVRQTHRGSPSFFCFSHWGPTWRLER